MSADADTDTLTRERRFAQVPDRLITDLRVDAHGVRLWCLLDRYAGSNGATFPSRARLANDLGVSVTTIKRSLVNLADTGWIIRTPRSGGSWATTLVDRPRKTRTVPPPRKSAEDSIPTSEDTQAAPVDHVTAEDMANADADDLNLWLQVLETDRLEVVEETRWQAGTFDATAIYHALRKPRRGHKAKHYPGKWLQACHDPDVALSTLGVIR